MVSSGQYWPMVWQVLCFVTQLFLSTHMVYNKDFLSRLETTLLSSTVLNCILSNLSSNSSTYSCSCSSFLFFILLVLFLTLAFPSWPKFIFQGLRLHLKQKQNYGSGLALGEHSDPGMRFSKARPGRGEVGRRICLDLAGKTKQKTNHC